MDLYYKPGSAPCRAVLMTAKAVGVDLNLKRVELMNGEHLTPEYLKINPQHTIPTLVDGEFSLWESRAIQIYLAEKYGKNDTLYPKCPKKRALVNQRLFFDMGTLYQRFGDYHYPQIFANAPADPEKFKKMEEAMGFLETFLDGKTYAAGDFLTIADLSLLATVSSYEVAKFDLSKYQNVTKWYNHIKSVAPGSDLNEQGCVEFSRFFK